MRVFYQGEIGRAIDRAMKDAGVSLSLTDLERDQADWRDPIAMTYRGHEIVTASTRPTPSPCSCAWA